jgi:hypothetical protein
MTTFWDSTYRHASFSFYLHGELVRRHEVMVEVAEFSRWEKFDFPPQGMSMIDEIVLT